MAKFYHSDGWIIDDDRNDAGGMFTQIHLHNTNRWHKVYYCDTYRADASPYIKINGLRYYLSEFLRDIA